MATRVESTCHLGRHGNSQLPRGTANIADVNRFGTVNNEVLVTEREREQTTFNTECDRLWIYLKYIYMCGCVGVVVSKN